MPSGADHGDAVDVDIVVAEDEHLFGDEVCHLDDATDFCSGFRCCVA